MTLESLKQEHTLEQDNWRKSFLQKILVISAILGLFALIPAVMSATDFYLQSIYIGVYITLVFSIIINIPYKLKATLFVSLPLIIGVGDLLETGIRGDGLFFLLAFVTLSALLIGTRAGWTAIILSEIVIIGMGFLQLNNYLSLADKLMVEGTILDWVGAGSIHLLITLVVLLGISMMYEGFNKVKMRAESILATLHKSQTELENRVIERTKELTQRTNKLITSAFVARQTAEIKELEELLNSSVDLIAKQFNYYHVGIYLINERGDYAELQAASSESGKQLIEKGYRLGVGTQGIVGFVAAERKARISQETDKDPMILENLEFSRTRSEIAVPLIVRNKVIGVLDIHSSELEAFKYEDLDIYQTLADHMAVAIENARVIGETELVIKQLEKISGENIRKNWKVELETGKLAYQYSNSGVRPITKTKSQKGKNSVDVPLVLRGQKIGIISLHRKSDFQKWTKEEEIIAKEVADQAALALENIRHIERSRESTNRDKLISNATSKIRETLDLETVLKTTAREIQQAFNLQEAEVRLLQEDNVDASKKNGKAPSSKPKEENNI
ncbi:MAG: GAF domain-containing protein [Anaerolineae bacterium]|nr:GAF domain-containing protein [Anaerolineae bacterium]MDK1080062.1 GAF domain-containing protein [Anaerolineae bacterium]